jgi:hypothetical protein
MSKIFLRHKFSIRPQNELKISDNTSNGHIIEPFLRIHWLRNLMFKASQRNMAEHCLAKKITQYRILNLWKCKIPTHDKGHHHTEAEDSPVMNISFTTGDTTK